MGKFKWTVDGMHFLELGDFCYWMLLFTDCVGFLSDLDYTWYYDVLIFLDLND